MVHCLDAAKGSVVWKHETNAAIWGCLLLAKDRLYAGNVDGVMTVLRTGRRKEELATDRDGRAAIFPPGAGRGRACIWPPQIDCIASRTKP